MLPKQVSFATIAAFRIRWTSLMRSLAVPVRPVRVLYARREPRVVRRLTRLVVLACCLISLAACIGAAWLWWRSYRTIDRVVWDRGGRHGQLSSVRGRVSL